MFGSSRAGILWSRGDALREEAVVDNGLKHDCGRREAALLRIGRVRALRLASLAKADAIVEGCRIEVLSN